jgi:hypothetical protein
VQVAIFLKEFKKVATEGGGLYVINREKNRDALIALGLTKNNRKEALLSLTVSDYCAGPKKTEIVMDSFGNLDRQSMEMKYT